MIIAIDGACKGNGKPDCIASGSAFFKMSTGQCGAVTTIDNNSTNQRGELHGLLLGLTIGIGLSKQEEAFFVTDSEYIYNTITKTWYDTWIKRGWKTANGDDVKNQDLWELIAKTLAQYDMDNFAIFHVKGHVIPFGAVTGNKLFRQDKTCKVLYHNVKQKYVVEGSKNIEHALEVFKKNHGYIPPMDTFNEMILCNTVADIAASTALVEHLERSE